MYRFNIQNSLLILALTFYNLTQRQKRESLGSTSFPPLGTPQSVSDRDLAACELIVTLINCGVFLLQSVLAQQGVLSEELDDGPTQRIGNRF